MKHLYILIMSLCCIVNATAQSEAPKYKGHFFNKEYGIHLKINLEEQNLEVPGYSFLGKVNGYMYGKIYGMWIMVSHSTGQKNATIRFSNDQGSDSQSIVISLPNDSTLTYKAINGNQIKRVVKRKLVKIPQELTFNKIK